MAHSPRLRPVRLIAGWLASAVALLLAAGVVGGADIRGFGGAVMVAAIVAVLNAILPPLVAALSAELAYSVSSAVAKESTRRFEKP